MARYIDAEEAIRRIDLYIENGSVFKSVLRSIKRLINNVPTADVVEVVRCNDCVLHNKCITEDVFILAGKQDGFCCVGKKVE